MLPRVFLNKVFVKKKFFHNPLIVFNLFFHKSVYFGRAGSAWPHGLLSSCSKGSPHGGFSLQSAALGTRAPFLTPVGSSWIRGQTCVVCIGSRLLYPCTTREAPFHKFLKVEVAPWIVSGNLAYFC